MKKAIIELLEVLKANLYEIEKKEYDDDKSDRNYFDAMSDAQQSITEAINELKK